MSTQTVSTSDLELRTDIERHLGEQPLLERPPEDRKP